MRVSLNLILAILGLIGGGVAAGCRNDDPALKVAPGVVATKAPPKPVMPSLPDFSYLPKATGEESLLYTRAIGDFIGDRLADKTVSSADKVSKELLPKLIDLAKQGLKAPDKALAVVATMFPANGDIAELLIKMGANPNTAGPKPGKSSLSSAMTTLGLAQTGGSIETSVAYVLIKNGANAPDAAKAIEALQGQAMGTDSFMEAFDIYLHQLDKADRSFVAEGNGKMEASYIHSLYLFTGASGLLDLPSKTPLLIMWKEAGYDETAQAIAKSEGGFEMIREICRENVKAAKKMEEMYKANEPSQENRLDPMKAARFQPRLGGFTYPI